MSFNLSENFCNFVNKEIAFICLIKLEWLTVCSYHATYAFQSESTLYSCLSVKETGETFDETGAKQARYLTFKLLQRDSNPQPFSL